MPYKEDSFRLQRSSISSLSSRQRQQIAFGGPYDPTIGHLYSLVLWDLRRNQVITNPELDPAGRRTSAEFNFLVPPKVHEMKEPFATTIVPTQNGGKYVESHGSLIRNVRLQGTTGLRPHKNSGFSALRDIPLLGGFGDLADATSSLLTQGFANRDTIPESEITGLDDILFLRNIFRALSDLRERGTGNHIAMMWRNAKDGDYWIVEPTDFKLQQSSSSPMTYEYVIELKTLAPYSAVFTYPEDPLSWIKSTQRFFSRVQQFNNAFRNAFLVVSTQIRRIEALGVFGVTAILSPIVSIVQGLQDIKSTTENFGTGIRHQAESLFSTITTGLAQLHQDDFEFKVLERQDPLRRELRRLQITCAALMTEAALQESVGTRAGAQKNRATKAYDKGGSAVSGARSPSVGGSSAFLGNQDITGNLAESKVHTGEDIRSLASRLLGDRRRWHTLVIINDLRAPYITPTGEEGTLAPGDSVLYPSEDPSSGTTANVNESDRESGDRDLTPAHRAFGRDLRLKTISVGGRELTDLEVNQYGDISTVVGVPNVEQAIKLKFSTEQGQLPAHPYYGARFPIGGKATPETFTEFHVNARATMLSDTRVQSVQKLDFLASGDTLFISANVVLNNTTDILSASFALRRF